MTNFYEEREKFPDTLEADEMRTFIKERQLTDNYVIEHPLFPASNHVVFRRDSYSYPPQILAWYLWDPVFERWESCQHLSLDLKDSAFQAKLWDGRLEGRRTDSMQTNIDLMHPENQW